MSSHQNNEEHPSFGRHPSSNGEWNQQTIYDARNVLQTQHSVEVSQQAHDQRAGKSKCLFSCCDKAIASFFFL